MGQHGCGHGLLCIRGHLVTLFVNQWLAGIGRTREGIMQSADRLPGPLPYVAAFVCAVVMAAALSCVVQLTGPQTAWRGMRVATALWMGFNLTVWLTEYLFEARPWSLLFINAGCWLGTMNAMGVIVGAWKKKAPVAIGHESRAAVKA